jgi:Rrf2 family protein
MRLTGKTTIAIRALYDMAFHCRGRQAQAKEIALRQRIPLRSLEEVLQDLRRAGLIDAQRGPRGGYMLARAPEEIAVLQIVRALEGPLERWFSLDDQSRGRSRRPGRVPAKKPGNKADLKAASKSLSTAIPPPLTTNPGETATDVPGLIWDDIAGGIAAILGQTTLGDFVARAESVGVKRVVNEPQMYFI